MLASSTGDIKEDLKYYREVRSIDGTSIFRGGMSVSAGWHTCTILDAKLCELSLQSEPALPFVGSYERVRKDAKVTVVSLSSLPGLERRPVMCIAFLTWGSAGDTEQAQVIHAGKKQDYSPASCSPV